MLAEVSVCIAKLKENRECHIRENVQSCVEEQTHLGWLVQTSGLMGTNRSTSLSDSLVLLKNLSTWGDQGQVNKIHAGDGFFSLVRLNGIYKCKMCAERRG